ncbi:unnamed protein product [Menidia menidia]|uniref:(Atlantic silverside) hypothetical protein n=1 Tax=Menidia menidia TaxID=238744 RepID=A0A8S4BQJ6_9TELE|nr:unnamed protein product [Menidia menidia]
MWPTSRAEISCKTETKVSVGNAGACRPPLSCPEQEGLQGEDNCGSGGEEGSSLTAPLTSEQLKKSLRPANDSPSAEEPRTEPLARRPPYGARRRPVRPGAGGGSGRFLLYLSPRYASEALMQTQRGAVPVHFLDKPRTKCQQFPVRPHRHALAEERPEVKGHGATDPTRLGSG